MEPCPGDGALEEFDDFDEASTWGLDSTDDDGLDSLGGGSVCLDAFTAKSSLKSIDNRTQMANRALRGDVSVKNTFIHIDEPTSGVMRKVRSEGDLLGLA